MHCFIVLKAGSLKSRRVPSEDGEGESGPGLFHILVVSGIVWLVIVFLCVSSHSSPFRVCLCVQVCLFQKDISDIGLVILISCKDPVSIRGYMYRYSEYTLQDLLGGHNLIYNKFHCKKIIQKSIQGIM